jgi:alkanesulfonate monooxygenase SsuD/methylene tetrahydromethanopterin reductase-like flavin-dependent oxidoreductase (luciferase family)
VVTDTGSARHFGDQPPLPHDAAYDRAEEWLSGIRRLWHSWGEGGLVADPAQGRYADGSKLDAFQQRGEYFSFDGPLNAIPFAAGDPVIVSPGGSGRGLGFAGANSDVQLALAPLDAASIREYRARIHAAASERGRDPRDINILFAIQPVLVSSPEEADRLVAESANPDDASILNIAERQSSDLETDLTVLDLDRPLDPTVFGDHVSQGSIKRLTGKFDPVTTPLKTLLGAQARLGRISDRTGFVGTAGEFADLIEDLGDSADNDGILLWGDLHPVTVHRILDELVPILRRRGILRTEFGGGGLRANLRDF